MSSEEKRLSHFYLMDGVNSVIDSFSSLKPTTDSVAHL